MTICKWLSIKLAASLIAIVQPWPAQAEPVEKSRIEVVDGDSVRLDGIEWRLKGFDTPEIATSRCEAERRLGLLAKARLEALITAATVVDLAGDGEKDRHKRPLGDLLLDGVNVRDLMVTELLARPYNGGRRKGWCSFDSREDLVPGLPPSRGKGKG
ncbi:MAG TPA: thermonuclease family protein [Hyphomicrobiaceae bacterium]|nr:thermonuclease family protein [Hyphomicrobiaceae bacterium]